MNRKLLFYDRYGVEEYYLYGPDNSTLNGWLRREGFLDVIEPIEQGLAPDYKLNLICLKQSFQSMALTVNIFLPILKSQTEQTKQKNGQNRQKNEPQG